MSDYFAQGPTGGADLFKQAHRSSDVDESRDALHHTLGDRPTQAAKGDHNHDNRYTPKSEFNEYDVTDLLLGPAIAGVTSNSKLTRRGDNVDIYVDFTSVAATAGNIDLVSIPAQHRKAGSNNRYFTALDAATAATVQSYVTGAGAGIATVFGRGAGTTVLGHISYVAVHL